MSEEPASFRLTRDYLAQVAPDVDPDQVGFIELCGLLAPKRLLPWLAQHPDQSLVARFWEEYEADCNGTVVETAILLARAGHTITIGYGDGQITLLPRHKLERQGEVSDNELAGFPQKLPRSHRAEGGNHLDGPTPNGFAPGAGPW